MAIRKVVPQTPISMELKSFTLKNMKWPNTTRKILIPRIRSIYSILSFMSVNDRNASYVFIKSISLREQKFYVGNLEVIEYLRCRIILSNDLMFAFLFMAVY
jgi:hypothetical protein